MQSTDIIDNKYTIVKKIGIGQFSHIYLVKDNNIEYAAKIVIKNTNEFQQELQMTTLASGLNNPNIIHLFNNGIGTIKIAGLVKNNKPYLILDYCSKGNLFNYIYEKRLSESQAKFVFKKILEGVQALHGAGICHRNLKLENILLDQNFNQKISDFALATKFIQNNQAIQLKDYVGSFHNISPQIINHQPYNGDKADIFSLGIILFNLVTGINGFLTSKNDDIYYKLIKEGNIDDYWNKIAEKSDIVKSLSKDLKNLYIKMVSFNEKDRPSVDEILQDHWFDEINNLNKEKLEELENNMRKEFEEREAKFNENKNTEA